MNKNTSTAPVRRKSEQAIKIAASWTPNEATADFMGGQTFGAVSPLHIRGGRLTINAAILADHGNPAMMTRVAERVAELKAELEAVGILHSFVTSAGAVPVGTAERLTVAAVNDPHEPYDEDAAAQGAA